MVTSGYTQGLWLTCRALAARGATTVAVEDPSLDDSWATIRSAGPGGRRACRSTSTGIGSDALDADAVLVTPAHQFPTGAVLAPERRRALLAWGGIVIEDDYDSEYRYDRAPVGTLQRLAPDRVVYLGTASKTLAPALRLGWLLAPPELAEAIAARALGGRLRRPGDRRARAYARLIATGELDRHLRRTRREYRERRDALVAALATRLPECRVEGVAAGLHLLLRLPPGTDEHAVVAALAERRIRIRGLASYRARAAATSPRWSSATAGCRRRDRRRGRGAARDLARRRRSLMTASSGGRTRYETRMGTHTSTQIEVGARVMANQALPEGLKPGAKGLVVGQAGWIQRRWRVRFDDGHDRRRARVRARAVLGARTLQRVTRPPRWSSSATA